MNEYTAFGLFAEAAVGLRVIVLSHTMDASRQAMADFEPFAKDDACTIHRSHGVERIQHPTGGSIDFTSQRSPRLRGMTADIVFIDYPEVIEMGMAEAVISASDGEIVRA